MSELTFFVSVSEKIAAHLAPIYSSKIAIFVIFFFNFTSNFPQRKVARISHFAHMTYVISVNTGAFEFLKNWRKTSERMSGK